MALTAADSVPLFANKAVLIAVASSIMGSGLLGADLGEPGVLCDEISYGAANILRLFSLFNSSRRLLAISPGAIGDSWKTVSDDEFAELNPEGKKLDDCAHSNPSRLKHKYIVCS